MTDKPTPLEIHNEWGLTPQRVIRRCREAEEALRECARLSGADLSGGFPTTPSLPVFAVREVKQLRDDYKEACIELGVVNEQGVFEDDFDSGEVQ